jgi:hypothetical protein
MIAQGKVERARRRGARSWLLVVGAAALATIPLLVRGNSCGHDFNVHLVSWLDCANAWRHGMLYPHWTPSANWGAGEPRFVFYPPLTWMAGAALGLAFGWHAAPIVFTFLCLAGTGAATRALALEACEDAVATLAGCTAIFSGFTLFTAYERTAFPEFTGGIWLPLLLLFALRGRSDVRRCAPRSRRWWAAPRIFDGSTAPLTVVLAACWLSNAPLGVIASYLLAAVALMAALLQKNWTPLLRAMTACMVALAATAFYWVPAKFEQRWVDIRQAIEDPGYNFENNWAFARHAGDKLALHDQVLLQVSWIALSMIGVAMVALLVCRYRGRLPVDKATGWRTWWVPLAAVPVVTLVLLFPVSRAAWSVLPEFRFLQYPWRWLEAVTAPMAIFFASAVWPARRWARRATALACAAGFAGATVYAGIFFFQVCDSEDAVPAVLTAYRAGAGFEGMYEYAPAGSDIGRIATGMPDGCLVQSADAVLGTVDPSAEQPFWSAKDCLYVLRWSDDGATGPEHLRMQGVSPRAGVLVLRLLRYPAWSIEVNGRPVSGLPGREDGLIAVPVAGGPLEVRIDWRSMPDVVASRWITLAGVLALLWLWRMEGKRLRAQVS